MSKDLETRLAAIEARAAIADLLHTYAAGVRAGDADAVAATLTDDATFETREGWAGSSGQTLSRLEGRAAIHAFLSGTFARVRLCPVVSNLEIALDGNTATSRCVLISHMLGTPNSVIAEYHDEMAYDGQWRFTARTVHMLVPPAR